MENITSQKSENNDGNSSQYEDQNINFHEKSVLSLLNDTNNKDISEACPMDAKCIEADSVLINQKTQDFDIASPISINNYAQKFNDNILITSNEGIEDYLNPKNGSDDFINIYQDDNDVTNNNNIANKIQTSPLQFSNDKIKKFVQFQNENPSNTNPESNKQFFNTKGKNSAFESSQFFQCLKKMDMSAKSYRRKSNICDPFANATNIQTLHTQNLSNNLIKISQIDNELPKKEEPDEFEKILNKSFEQLTNEKRRQIKKRFNPEKIDVPVLKKSRLSGLVRLQANCLRMFINPTNNKILIGSQYNKRQSVHTGTVSETIANLGNYMARLGSKDKREELPKPKEEEPSKHTQGIGQFQQVGLTHKHKESQDQNFLIDEPSNIEKNGEACTSTRTQLTKILNHYDQQQHQDSDLNCRATYQHCLAKEAHNKPKKRPNDYYHGTSSTKSKDLKILQKRFSKDEQQDQQYQVNPMHPHRSLSVSSCQDSTRSIRSKNLGKHFNQIISNKRKKSNFDITKLNNTYTYACNSNNGEDMEPPSPKVKVELQQEHVNNVNKNHQEVEEQEYNNPTIKRAYSSQIKTRRLQFEAKPIDIDKFKTNLDLNIKLLKKLNSIKRNVASGAQAETTRLFTQKEFFHLRNLKNNPTKQSLLETSKQQHRVGGSPNKKDILCPLADEYEFLNRRPIESLNPKSRRKHNHSPQKVSPSTTMHYSKSNTHNHAIENLPNDVKTTKHKFGHNTECTYSTMAEKPAHKNLNPSISKKYSHQHISEAKIIEEIDSEKLQDIPKEKICLTISSYRINKLKSQNNTRFTQKTGITKETAKGVPVDIDDMISESKKGSRSPCKDYRSTSYCDRNPMGVDCHYKRVNTPVTQCGMLTQREFTNFGNKNRNKNAGCRVVNKLTLRQKNIDKLRLGVQTKR